MFNLLLNCIFSRWKRNSKRPKFSIFEKRDSHQKHSEVAWRKLAIKRQDTATAPALVFASIVPRFDVYNFYYWISSSADENALEAPKNLDFRKPRFSPEVFRSSVAQAGGKAIRHMWQLQHQYLHPLFFYSMFTTFTTDSHLQPMKTQLEAPTNLDFRKKRFSPETFRSSVGQDRDKPIRHM